MNGKWKAGQVGWTEERVELLKLRYGEGLSASQCAAELGGFEHTADRGRNAVIGKLGRLGLLGSRGAGRRPKPRQPAPIQERNGKIARDREAMRRIWLRLGKKWLGFRPPPSLPEPAVEAPPTPVPIPLGGVSILELDGHNCRWPLWDGDDDPRIYCGNPTETGPYCTAHAAIAFNYEPRRARA